MLILEQVWQRAMKIMKDLEHLSFGDAERAGTVYPGGVERRLEEILRMYVNT